MWDPVGEAALLTETETNSWRNLESVTGAQTENAKRNKVPSASSSQCVCVHVCVCVRACVCGLYNCVFASSGRQSGGNVFPSKAAYCLPGSRFSARYKDGESRKGWRWIWSGHLAPPPSISPHFYLHLFIFLIPLCESSSQTSFHISTKDDPLNEMSRRYRLI